MAPRDGSKEALAVYNFTLAHKDKKLEAVWAQAMECYDAVNEQRKQGKHRCKANRERERTYIKHGPGWDTIPDDPQFLQDLVSVKYLKTTPRANFGSMATANARSKEQFARIRVEVGKAFAKIRDGGDERAIKIISDSIWGYGPVTATLLLSLVAPDKMVFCCDQVLDVANSGMERKYALKECLNAVENVKALRDVLNNIRGDDFWTMEMCGKAIYVMGILHGELVKLSTLPSELTDLLSETKALIAEEAAEAEAAGISSSASGRKRKRA